MNEGQGTLIPIDQYEKLLQNTNLNRESGKITEVKGLLIKGFLPGASMGSLCRIFPTPSNDKSFLAEVVGFQNHSALFMPLKEPLGLGMGSRVILEKHSATIKVGDHFLGRVIDGFGQPIDEIINSSEKKKIERSESEESFLVGSRDRLVEMPLYGIPKNPLQRRNIEAPLDVGVRAINGLLTLGQGQRIGIMAGSGVGKSVLLGMMSRYTTADVNVIALIGERGREVKEFIERDLGVEGMKKSVVVVVTSDQSPLLRMRGAHVATAISEYFCQQGKNVLLMMDSITRFAMAQREIGLSAGEPPSTKGYTPSVFSHLPKLLERPGSFIGQGSITGIYTVLIEGDDLDDPIGDTVRSIVDGHIVLSRNLAHRGHYPSIDVLQSISRVMKGIVSQEQMKLVQKTRECLAIYKDTEDLINIGAYKAGSNPKIDKAVRTIDQVNEFLKQDVEDGSNMTQSLRALQGAMIQY